MNTDPWPIALAASMRPPCISTIERAMASPSPLPEARASPTFVPRKKRSNTSGSSGLRDARAGVADLEAAAVRRLRQRDHDLAAARA